MASKLDIDAIRTESVIRWLAIAIKDRRIANVLLGSADFENALYHLQQASEKILKAHLVAHGQEAPKTHSIDKLILSSVAIDAGIAGIHDVGIGSERMTELATYYRYPNPDKIDTTNEEEVNAAIKFVNSLYTYLECFFDNEIWHKALEYANLKENPFLTTLPVQLSSCIEENSRSASAPKF